MYVYMQHKFPGLDPYYRSMQILRNVSCITSG